MSNHHSSVNSSSLPSFFHVELYTTSESAINHTRNIEDSQWTCVPFFVPQLQKRIYGVSYLYMSAKDVNDSPAPDAIVLYANYYSFMPGQTINQTNSRIQSLMLFWCKSGRGTVSAEGKDFPFSQGCFMILPWNHRVCYRADAEDPFLLAGVHIVPELVRRGDVSYSIFHSERPDLPSYQERHDLPSLGFSELLYRDFIGNRAMETLAEYIVAWFQRQPHEEFMARTLAQALIGEMLQVKNGQCVFSEDSPQILRVLLEFIDKNIEKRIGIAELAGASELSRSTVFRLFKTHLGSSPERWILKSKMFHAAKLLKTTNLRIGEIGSKVCVDDPYYFSRVFKQIHGTPAMKYRRMHSLLVIPAPPL